MRNGLTRRDFGVLTGAIGLVAALGGRAAAATGVRREVFGRSVQGRELSAYAVGRDDAPARLLVVGCIHGSETAGLPIVARLLRAVPPAGAQLWLVPSANPDGALRGTRQNARGVDLNRNFPAGWHPNGARGGTYYPGPKALSEPESAALATLIRRLRPHVSVWYHQHLDVVDLSGGDPAVERGYARRVGMRLEQLSRYGGSVATWQNLTFPGTTAMVVELPARVPGPMQVRHAGAVLAAAADLAAGPPTG